MVSMIPLGALLIQDSAGHPRRGARCAIVKVMCAGPDVYFGGPS